MSGVAEPYNNLNNNVVGVVQPSEPIEEVNTATSTSSTTTTTTLVESSSVAITTQPSSSLLSVSSTTTIFPELQISVSGAPGAAATNGIHGNHGIGTNGQNGQAGTSATKTSQPGQAAGQIELHLSSSSSSPATATSSLGSYSCDPTILAQYAITTSTTGQADLLEQSVYLVPQFIVQKHGNNSSTATTPPPPSLSSSVVQVSAVGGTGGNGGIGGNGGNGDRGRHGRDASYLEHSTNGGSGGDGGDAGCGSVGAKGGAGGTIEIHVSDADTYLLMLVHACSAPECLVVGGTGGKQGQHGTPGQGGPGGKGGSEYRQWVGKHYIYKIAGFPGPNGRTGRPADAPLHDGEKGAPGVFQIHVTSQGSVNSYPKRYDVICRHVELTSIEALPSNNVFQFTDTVHVASFVVENIGPMPTPIEPIQCFMHPDNSILLLDDNRTRIQNRLAPTSPMTIRDCMSFHIRAPDIRTMDVNMEPYCLSKTLYLGAQQLGPAGFACGYEKFHNNGVPVEFRFPVQNSKGLVGWRYSENII